MKAATTARARKAASASKKLPNVTLLSAMLNRVLVRLKNIEVEGIRYEYFFVQDLFRVPVLIAARTVRAQITVHGAQANQLAFRLLKPFQGTAEALFTSFRALRLLCLSQRWQEICSSNQIRILEAGD